MSFTSKYFLFAVLGGIFTTSPLFAQQAESTFSDINYIRKSNPFLNSNNAAGLSQYNGPNISIMEAFYNKSNGNFRNYHQSNNSQTFGLNTDAIKRINSKVVIEGGLSYENFKGKNMTGSTFIDPYVNPFDIVEWDEKNSGSKTLERYGLNGAIGTNLTDKLSVGGKLNYAASNYAKQRDLRHTNKLLDLNASVGLLYKLNDVLELGANYNYDRRIESITFKIYGNTDRVFMSLIDFGAFYGRNELFGSTGYTASSSTSPLKDISQGGSVQLNINFNAQTKLYNQFTYGKRTGFFGEEGTSSILFNKHNGTNLAYNGTLSLKGSSIEQLIALDVDYSSLNNKESIFRQVTTTGGVNQIVYFGFKEVSTGDKLNVGLDYNVFLGVNNNLPKWTLNVKADYFSKDQNVNLYPYYRKQTINNYQVFAQVNRQIQRVKDAFNVGLGLGFGAGNGEMANDGVFVLPAAGNIAPASMDLFLNQEFEYFTADRLNANVAFKYTKALENNIGLFVKTNYALSYAPSVNYLGKYFGSAGVSIGCTF